VVSRDSARIAFLLTTLNNCNICFADIGNAYLNADCCEKIWTVGGLEFGSDEGSIMIIKKALYGLKSSGAAWRAHFATTLAEMGFISTIADPDVWIRAAVDERSLYYEMILIYVDDILCISKDTKSIMDCIRQSYWLKEGSHQAPEQYLGANIEKWTFQDGQQLWSMSAKSYIKSAIENIEGKDQFNHKLRSGAHRPMKADYCPEVDISPVLSDTLATYYQGLIGVLRWTCELGRIDILTEVSMLSSHNALPREGHLEAVLDVFAYLKKHQLAAIVFDNDLPIIDE
jgi:hypothetical protein